MLPSRKQIDFVRDIAAFLQVEQPDMTDRRKVVSFINQYKYPYYKKRDEMIKKKIIEEIPIEVFAEELGMQLVRKGRYFAVKGHENSLRIDPQKRRFWLNSKPGGGRSIGSGGDVIDFAKEFAGMNTHEAFTYFTGRVFNGTKQGPVRNGKMSEKQEEGQEQKKKLQLPQRDNNMRRVFAYLTKSRKIEKEVVQYFVDERMLYQDMHGNCVFVGYDERKVPVYGFYRGTHTERRFLGDCKGSDYEYGYYICNQSPNLIIAESVIDGMSIMSILYKQKKNFKAYDFCFLCGTCKYESVVKHAEHNSEKIYLAVDNDKAGKTSIEKMKEMFAACGKHMEIHVWLPEEGLDWNEAYQKALVQGSIETLNFEEGENL